MFNSFTRLCEAPCHLERPSGLEEHDVIDGINDEATLLYVSLSIYTIKRLWTGIFGADTIARRFFYTRQCDYRQFKETCLARDVNQLCSFYWEIDVHAYEETRIW